MSSTEYKAELRDIQFLLHNVLNVGELAKLDKFSDFDEETFRETVSAGIEFSEKVLAPLNKVGDVEGAILKDGKVTTPTGFKDAWKQLSDAGWLGITSPEEYGGLGLPETIGMAVKEALNGANPAFWLYTILTVGSSRLIYSFGSEEDKATYCEKMYTGEWTGSMCLTEPNAGSYVGDAATTAKKAEDGDHYLIQGNKIFITGGEQDLGGNIIHLVLARTPGAPAGTKGLSLFIVPKHRIENDGLVFNDVHAVSLEHKMGIKGSATTVLSFGDEGDCHGYLLQETNRGMAQMFQMMNEARLGVALQGVGQAAAAYQNALAFANERTQGVSISAGKNAGAERVKIVEHADIKDSLVKMKSSIDATRGMTYATAYYLDMAEYGPEETREYYQDLADIHVPIAKAYSTDEGLETVSTGIQILGGVGYTQEFPLEQNYRDLRIAPIYEGTNGIQALDLIGRKLTIHKGRLFQNLIKEFNTISDDVAQTEVLKESIRTWLDYVGGLIVVISDYANSAKDRTADEQVLPARNILRLFGDILGCFYLIKQGIASEKALEELDIDFSNIKELAKENLDVRFYYNKLVLTEYFALNVLPRQEGYINIIKRNATSALDAILTL
ncbi:MAG: alkylation response protein AidB-like acyl-CoA dehydrogenase [bacterium]|jgi:alkylation response protein AidB-like acyl-CoA dehydrogenase